MRLSSHSLAISLMVGQYYLKVVERFLSADLQGPSFVHDQEVRMWGDSSMSPALTFPKFMQTYFTLYEVLNHLSDGLWTQKDLTEDQQELMASLHARHRLRSVQEDVCQRHDVNESTVRICITNLLRVLFLSVSPLMWFFVFRISGEGACPFQGDDH